MGLDYQEIDFDRPRRLRFRIRDLRDLCAALGNAAGPLTLVELLQRLAGIDLNALFHTVRYGLLHEEPKLTLRRAEELVEAHLEKHGNLTRLNEAIAKLINETGLIATDRGDRPGEAAGGPSA